VIKGLIEVVNGEAVTNSLVLAEEFGRRHDHVLESIRKLHDSGSIGAPDFRATSYTDKSNRQTKMFELTERGFLIAMPFIGGSKAQQGQVRLVDAFLASRGQRAQPPVPPRTITELDVAESAAQMLRMSDPSKIRMLSVICEGRGIDPGFLPQYVQEDLTKALGDLLKDHDSDLSAVRANKVLMEMGYLQELDRRASGGKIKKFKSITEAGLMFGRNETCPRNPNETQPRYYVKPFPRLLDLINAWLSSEGGES